MDNRAPPAGAAADDAELSALPKGGIEGVNGE
jgi:hypothetical protein